LLNKYKNFFFDLDGTVTDPKEGIVNSYIFSLEKMGIKQYDRETISTYIGASLHLCFADEYKIPENDIDAAVKYYREYFGVKGLYENKVYDGIPQILRMHRENKNELFLVTSKPTVYAKEILRHFNLPEYYTKIYGSGLTTHNTAKEVLIHDALSENNLNYNECIMIGDRKHDIIGANANQVDSIAVSYGYGSEEEFIEHKPTYLVHSVKELSELLLTLVKPQ